MHSRHASVFNLVLQEEPHDAAPACDPPEHMAHVCPLDLVIYHVMQPVDAEAQVFDLFGGD